MRIFFPHQEAFFYGYVRSQRIDHSNFFPEYWNITFSASPGLDGWIAKDQLNQTPVTDTETNYPKKLKEKQKTLSALNTFSQCVCYVTLYSIHGKYFWFYLFHLQGNGSVLISGYMYKCQTNKSEQEDCDSAFAVTRLLRTGCKGLA